MANYGHLMSTTPTNSQLPFTISIFVADGNPDGLRIVEKSNWIGKAVIFPRAIYTVARKRAEFNQAGVYLLLGPRENAEGEKLYIGEGDPIGPRLREHYGKKDFWNRVVFFVAGQEKLNKAYVQYLEAQLVSRAKVARRMPLDNTNTPTEPTLSESERADMDIFLHNMLDMLPVLGIHAFEQSPAFTSGETSVLFCEGSGASARGVDTPQGFVVQSGSLAVAEPVPSLKKHLPNIVRLRADLLKSGLLVRENDKLRFVQDYTFTSPSTAATVVQGRASNGRTDWKDSSGRTLKQIQEAAASSY